MTIFNSILIIFAIYSFAVSAGVISEKSGQLNIAINAMMLFGALFGALAHIMFNKFGPVHPGGANGGTLLIDFVSILIGAIGGVASSFMLSFATLKTKADPGIAGTAMNILAPTLILVIEKSKNFATHVWGSTTTFQVNTSKYDGLNHFYLAAFFLALVVIAILFIVFKKTKWGFRLESIGDNHVAAGISGINVNRMRFTAMTISGALAGAAGSLFVIQSNGSFGNNVSGIGFIALCMIAMSGWKMWRVPIVTLLVAILFSLSVYFTTTSNTVPREVFMIIPFIAPLVILPIFAKTNKSPRMIGIPYEGDGR